jgi:two-component system cell cycle response regulator DivK
MPQHYALIVDDNVQNLKVLAQLLAKQGVIVTEINDPRKVATLLPELEQVDVAFVDLEMPNLTGFEVKDQLKAQFSHLRVVAYTVHVSEIGVVKNLGFDGFLGKPINPDKFPDQLARILSGQAVWETL